MRKASEGHPQVRWILSHPRRDVARHLLLLSPFLIVGIGVGALSLGLGGHLHLFLSGYRFQNQKQNQNQWLHPLGTLHLNSLYFLCAWDGVGSCLLVAFVVTFKMKFH